MYASINGNVQGPSLKELKMFAWNMVYIHCISKNGQQNTFCHERWRHTVTVNKCHVIAHTDDTILVSQNAKRTFHTVEII